MAQPVFKFFIGEKFPGDVSLQNTRGIVVLLVSIRKSIQMTDQKLLSRVRVSPEICSGRPYIRGTRIRIAVILDALVEGLTPAEILEHYPVLGLDDIRAAVAYATQLAENNGGIVFVNHNPPSLFQLR